MHPTHASNALCMAYFGEDWVAAIAWTAKGRPQWIDIRVIGPMVIVCIIHVSFELLHPRGIHNSGNGDSIALFLQVPDGRSVWESPWHADCVRGASEQEGGASWSGLGKMKCVSYLIIAMWALPYVSYLRMLLGVWLCSCHGWACARE